MGYEHIDVTRIARLTRELADDASAGLRFIDDYLAGWERRQARIETAVEGAAVADALAALLSLSTSSAMVGADSLSAAANELHAEARLRGTVPARGAEQLARLGRAVCAELRLAAAAVRATAI